MAKVKIKENKNVFINGTNSVIFAGTILDSDGDIYKKYPELFEVLGKTKKTVKEKKNKVIKTEDEETKEVIKTEEVEEIKEVIKTEEVEEAKTEDESKTSKRRKRRS